jgi:phosphoglycolate phosphatase-like HAD superfamily hydrolase
MTAPGISLVWLFDIDGTLLLTKGAGREALVRALRSRYAIDDDLKSIPFPGRTDLLITNDIAAKHGIVFEDGQRARFFAAVAAEMRRLMDPPRGALLPGAAELLEAVAAEPAWVSALLTGNESEMARIKLEAFGISHRFAWGAFGEEGPDRDAIACLAVQRAALRHGVAPDRCVVVGDTEHDVACARAAGAKAVAVASGSHTRDRLAACGPDLLLDDLRDPAALVAWARRL